MKFFAATVALALAATATAQKIAISNPTAGTRWEVGKPQRLIWSGNCASMGANAANVSVQIVNGPSGAVQFRGDVGKLDCSGGLTSIDNIVIPADVEAGEYSIRVLTQPDPSYSPPFTVVNTAKPATPSTSATTDAPKPTTGSGASKVVAGSMALAGVVAAMLL
ncbi:hypothetical protein BGZ82_009443 [Podila clonocystis]|nr:hypothetical protein BGZ82_009443 [Podila clonocystis]